MIKRYQNDIKIRWAIFAEDGTPEDFSDKTIVALEARKGLLRIALPIPEAIIGSVIETVFLAKEQQKNYGFYDLYIQYTRESPDIRGGVETFTKDVCNAFKLVKKTCELHQEGELIVKDVVSGLSYSMLSES